MFMGRDELFILFACLAVFALVTNGFVVENDASRFATAESLVERGTFVIDGATPRADFDRVLIGGHFYSDKPPILSIFAAVVYYPLHLAGMTFGDSSGAAYYLVSLALIGFSTSALAVVFYRSLTLVGLGDAKRLFLTFTLVGSTQLLYYSQALNNHSLAAALLFSAFYLVLRVKSAELPRGWLIVAGLMSGIAAGVDFPPGIIFSAAFAAMVVSRKKFRFGGLYFAAGLVPPLLSYLLLNVYILGGIMPSQGHSEYFDYPESIYLNSRDPSFTDSTPWYVPKPERLLEYVVSMLFGSRGFLSNSPVLVVSAIALVSSARSKEGRFEGRLILAACMLTAIFYILYDGKRMTYGGGALGYRWLIPLIPFLVFFTHRIFMEGWSRRWVKWAVFLSAVSFFLSLILLLVPNSPWITPVQNFHAFLVIPLALGAMVLTPSARSYLQDKLSADKPI